MCLQAWSVSCRHGHGHVCRRVLHGTHLGTSMFLHEIVVVRWEWDCGGSLRVEQLKRDVRTWGDGSCSSRVLCGGGHRRGQLSVVLALAEARVEDVKATWSLVVGEVLYGGERGGGHAVHC